MVTFTACRSKPELVVPARATPREIKLLSDIDNQPYLRLYATIIEFLRRRVPGSPDQRAAGSIIKAALAEALVSYYPVAGRLREVAGGNQLVVDCTAEGVVLVEAYADVRLEELGKPLVPPYPCVDELICEVGDLGAVVWKPLLYLQMTEFKCGGLSLALTMCHSIVDAFGKVELLKCIIDIVRGQALPSVLPSWERHLLVSSSKAAPESGDHNPAAFAEPTVDNDSEPPTQTSMIPLEGMRDPPLPPGFYGNALISTIAEATAGELGGRPLADAVDLVHEAKFRVTDEYVRSVLDLLARGERYVDVGLNTTFFVSDITRCGDDSMDLGWAERVGGSSMAGDIYTRLSSLYMSCKNSKGEECVLVPMVLPEPVMERFASLIAAVTKVPRRSLL
ncbi:hypothetical protein ACQ4PT_032217 [Festuca glaucescens]